MKLTINIHWNLNRNVFTMLFAADVENILSRAIRKIVVPASYKKKMFQYFSRTGVVYLGIYG